MLGEGVDHSFPAEVWEVSGVTAAPVDQEFVGKAVDPGWDIV